MHFLKVGIDAPFDWCAILPLLNALFLKGITPPEGRFNPPIASMAVCEVGGAKKKEERKKAVFRNTVNCALDVETKIFLN